MSASLAAPATLPPTMKDLCSTVAAVTHELLSLHQCDLTLCGASIAQLVVPLQIATPLGTVSSARLKPCRTQQSLAGLQPGVCVCVCVCEREREMLVGGLQHAASKRAE